MKGMSTVPRSQSTSGPLNGKAATHQYHRQYSQKRRVKEVPFMFNGQNENHNLAERKAT